MMRRLSLGIIGVAAIGAAALVSAPAAQAQSWSLSIETGHGGGYVAPVRGGWDGYGGYGGRDRGHHRGWDRGRDRGWHGGHGHGWGGRPVFGGGYAGFRPRCHVRKVRYWDGWSWVVDRRQVCG